MRVMNSLQSLSNAELVAAKSTLNKREHFLRKTILGPVINEINQIDIELKRREINGQAKGHDHTS